MAIIDTILAAGPLSDNILQITTDEDNTFFVQSQYNTFALFVNGSRVVFEAIIDTDIVAHRERTLAALLTYNAIWEDTGFIRMALTGNGRDAQAILIADMLLDDFFTGENVAKFIDDLDAKIQIWRDIIGCGADSGATIFQTPNNVKV